MSEDDPNRGGAGFALGVAIGAAVAVLLSEDGKKVRSKAKQKLDQLAGGQAPEELLDSLKDVVGTVIEDIQDSAKSGQVRTKRTRKVIKKTAKRIKKATKDK